MQTVSPKRIAKRIDAGSEGHRSQYVFGLAVSGQEAGMLGGAGKE
jgi:hypothetical protein